MRKLAFPLPDDFIKPEMREDYFVSSQMKKIWSKQLELLYVFDEVCQRNNIEYFVIAGTLLGAIRHNGYIPWDDDIDVVMKRDQYELLCKIAPTEFSDPFCFQTEYSDPGSFRLHAQLRNSNTTAIIKEEYKYQFPFNQGIFIDIFPLDKMSDHKLIRKLDKHILHLLWGLGFYTSHFTTRYNVNVIHNRTELFFHSCLSLLNINQHLELLLFKLFELYLSRHKKGTESYIYALHSQRFIWKSNWFEQRIKHPFEFLSIFIPSEYDLILKKTYGDWHKKVKGSAVHGSIIYDTDRPYSDYLL